jgi:hypothetical protein
MQRCDTQLAGILAFDILRNDFHRPFVDGKCNRDNIEEQVTIGVLSGKLEPVTQEEVELAMDIVDELIVQYS